MSVVGFDFGNGSCVVAVAKHVINVVLNDEYKRETPTIVSFGEKQPIVGIDGATSALMNPKNTISQIKRLIGLPFSDPELQKDLKLVPFTVTEGPDGFPLIHAMYLGQNKTFTPTQVLGMLLSSLKGIAEKNLNASVVDCCIGIPVYFTDLQRRAILDAAIIAGLNPLRLIHETTATASAYGFYKTDLPENDPINVAFVDVGHSSLQVCIGAFRKCQVKILSHSFDRSLGGRDFDEILFQHFVTKFKDEYNIDVHQNERACVRLRAACEKLKKLLSANHEASLTIECLMEAKDVRVFITRNEFEEISIPILERVKKPLEKALVEAGLCTKEIHTVEVVGSGSMVPAIMKIMTAFFRKELCRTMDASESLAKGCALECAIHSPTIRVKDFQVNDIFPFPISMSWKGLAGVAAVDQYSTIVIPKGTPIPSLKAVTVATSGTFAVSFHYADASALQAPAHISTYMVGPIKVVSGDRAMLKIRVRLNLHGIVSADLATLLEEISFPVVKDASKMDIDVSVPILKKTSIPVVKEASTDISNRGLLPETVVTMQNAKGKAYTAENDMPESAETSAHEAEAKAAKPVQMDKDYKENSKVVGQFGRYEMLMEEKRTMEAIISNLELKNEKMKVLLLEKDNTVKDLEKQCMDLKSEASKRDEMLMAQKKTTEALLSELKFKNEKMEVLLLEKDDTLKKLEKQCMDLKFKASKRDEMMMEEKRTIEATLSNLKVKNEKLDVLLSEKGNTVKELEKRCKSLKFEASKRDETLMEEKRTIKAKLSEFKNKYEKMEVLLSEKGDTVKELERQCMGLKFEARRSAIKEKYCLIALVVSWLFLAAVMYSK
ncbi:heat shock 70 kDa protein 14-like [Silene latifolia]|uniref:heat shock 70 kDa protein 14-like n=1 Tax=Silene latifolia TaxID=37657 RepID=UPI003D775334